MSKGCLLKMEEKRFTLRMNGDLFNELAESAKKNRRSTAKEIECAIAFYLKDQKAKEQLNNTSVDKS